MYGNWSNRAQLQSPSKWPLVVWVRSPWWQWSLQSLWSCPSLTAVDPTGHMGCSVECWLQWGEAVISQAVSLHSKEVRSAAAVTVVSAGRVNLNKIQGKCHVYPLGTLHISSIGYFWLRSSLSGLTLYCQLITSSTSTTTISDNSVTLLKLLVKSISMNESD